ncbi:MAG: hypothetical protein K0B01_08010 [Syntrophobacterales bacterium]|nr:hypothetical protein [Syntrophobacterales bacterium]
MISESRRFITESCQKAAHNSLQVLGGIGYMNVFPVERIFRDIRLATIWTGTSEAMSMIVAHEAIAKLPILVIPATILSGNLVLTA